MKKTSRNTIFSKKNRWLAAIVIVLFLFDSSLIAQGQPAPGGTPISGLLYGQNTWIPSFVTFETGPSNGQFENVIADIANQGQSPFNLIRIGGAEFERDLSELFPRQNGNTGPFDISRAVALINTIRSVGAEPIIQISTQYAPEDAAMIVTQLNSAQSGVSPVLNFTIGNEPDLEVQLPFNGETFMVDGNVIENGNDVATYYRLRAIAMKEAIPNINIFGPDYSFFVDAFDNNPANGQFEPVPTSDGSDPWQLWHLPFLSNAIMTETTGNGDYLIDSYAIHVYQNNDIENVERKLQNLLIPEINRINSLRGDNSLSWAITETNTTTNNVTTPNPNDLQTWSFGAGQWLARLYGLGMQYQALNICPWSMFEAEGARTDAFDGGDTDLSFFDAPGFGGSELPFPPRSTYNHQRMLAENAKTRLGVVENSNAPAGVFFVATKDETGTSLMVVNSGATTYEVDVNVLGFNAPATPFLPAANVGDLNISSTTPGIQAALATNPDLLTVNGQETKMYMFDGNDTFQMINEYNSNDAANGGAFRCIIPPLFATFYDFCDFKRVEGSKFAESLAPGRYTRDELVANGILDNEISGVQVPPGLEVTLYDGEFFNESVLANLTEDANCSSSIAFDGDRKVSSLIISQIGAAAPPEVTFFSSCLGAVASDFVATLPVGRYTRRQLEANGITNNDISGVQIPEESNLQVTLFKKGNFSGNSITLNATNFCLNTLGFNNNVSSVIIEKTVAFFDFCDFTDGKFEERLSIGRYTKDELINNGILNNEISGVQLADGLEVTLFDGELFNGQVLATLTEDADCSVSFPFDNGNNRVSSVIISEIGQEAPAEIIFYDWPDFNPGGDFEVALPIGEYTLADLEAAGINNNDISSLVVPEGLQVTFYDGSNFNNGMITYATPQAVDLFNTFVDQRISSMRIEAASTERSSEAKSSLNQEVSDILLYPNPVTNVLNISGMNDSEQIIIANLQGQVLMQTTGNKIDVSTLGIGVYFVKIGFRETTFKFIKK